MNSQKNINLDSNSEDASECKVNDIPIQTPFNSMNNKDSNITADSTINSEDSKLDSNEIINEENANDSELNQPLNEVEILQQQVHELNVKLDKAEEKTLMALANLENTRRRLEKERLDALKFGATPFIRDILTVADNLERAINSVTEPNKITKDMWHGVEITSQNMQSVFSRHSIEKISPEIGTNVDYENHQAIGQEENDAVPEGSIAKILQVGYKLHNRLLRPANIMVAIAKTKESKDKEEAEKISIEQENEKSEDDNHKPYNKNI